MANPNETNSNAASGADLLAGLRAKIRDALPKFNGNPILERVSWEDEEGHEHTRILVQYDNGTTGWIDK